MISATLLNKYVSVDVDFNGRSDRTQRLNFYGGFRKVMAK
jgi:hypothetical protein